MHLHACTIMNIIWTLAHSKFSQIMTYDQIMTYELKFEGKIILILQLLQFFHNAQLGRPVFGVHWNIDYFDIKVQLNR